MGKLSVILFLIVFAVIFAFAFVNTETISITVPYGDVYELPKFMLIFISAFSGMIVMFLYFAIRDTKKYIDGWQVQKRQRKEMRVQELYSRALNAILAKNDKDARDALEGILKEEPDHIDTLLRLGDIAVADDDHQQAQSYYQRARELFPRKIETLFALETVMEKIGKWDAALRYLDDILDIDDNNLTALYRKRDIFERQGKWDDIVYLQKLIVKNEQHEKDKKRENQNLIGYEYEYGRFNLENNRLEKAKKAFKTVLRADKDFVPAQLGLAEVMLQEGESEEAVNLLEKAFETSGTKILLARLEDLLISLGEPSRLITIYKTSISKNPNDPVLRFFLGKLYYRLEMIDDAFETLSGIDTGGRTYPQLFQLLGNLYLRKHDPRNAAEEFKKAVSILTSLRVPYCCSACSYTADEWSGRCSSCGRWNTYRFNLYGSCRV